MRRRLALSDAKAIGRALDKIGLARGYLLRGNSPVDTEWCRLRLTEASDELRPLIAKEAK